MMIKCWTVHYNCAKLTRVVLAKIRSSRRKYSHKKHSVVFSVPLLVFVWQICITRLTVWKHLNTQQDLLNNLLFFQADVDNVGSDFDLNSLIEGDVDDDEFGDNKAEREESKTPVVSFYEPLKVRYNCY